MHYYLISIAPFKQAHLYLYISQALNITHSGTIVAQKQTIKKMYLFVKRIVKSLLWVQ